MRFGHHTLCRPLPKNETLYTPTDTPAYQVKLLWRGPTWVNTNWLIIDGLERYGFKEDAEELKKRTLDMVAKAGPYEYFDPIDGKGLGAAGFSWTAALIIDLLKD